MLDYLALNGESAFISKFLMKMVRDSTKEYIDFIKNEHLIAKDKDAEVILKWNEHAEKLKMGAIECVDASARLFRRFGIEDGISELESAKKKILAGRSEVKTTLAADKPAAFTDRRYMTKQLFWSLISESNTRHRSISRRCKWLVGVLRAFESARYC